MCYEYDRKEQCPCAKPLVEVNFGLLLFMSSMIKQLWHIEDFIQLLFDSHAHILKRCLVVSFASGFSQEEQY